MTVAPAEQRDPYPVRVVRVRLKHYRSIRACDVALGPLTFLVGPNGAGKSNFLDALRLVADSLTFSLDQALRERSGISEVRRRSPGHPHHVSVRLDMQFCHQAASYAFDEAEGGVTRLARPDLARRSALQEKLFTAGELLRVNQLTPDPNAEIGPSQLAIFDALPA